MTRLALPGTMAAQRQRQAYNLVARGYSISKIASAIGVREETVRKYIEVRKNELSSMVDKIKKEDYAALVLSRFEQARSEAWNLVEQAQKPGERTRALKLVVEIDTKEASILQKLGLLETAPVVEEQNINATIKIEHVNREHLDALAAQVLADKMGISPQEAISMCGYSQKAMAVRDKMLTPHVEDTQNQMEEAEIVPVTTPLDFD